MPLSKEFYLDQIKSKYPNSYNKSLEDLPVKDLEDMLDFLDEALDKADGGSIGIEVLFKEKMANGGRVPMLSGGALKTATSGIMKLFGKGDDAVDLAKQEEIFRSGDITTDFLEKVDDKVIKKFITTRDTKGPGGYGMYDSFDDMPNGLKAAELISRIKTADGGINYEAAELFIGKKLKGDETVDELIKMVIKKPGLTDSPLKDFENYVLKGDGAKDGGRVGLFMGGPALEGQALDIYTSMNKYGFSDQEIADALSARGLYTPSGTTPDTPDQGIINQQLQTGGGGGGDGPTGPTGPTFNRNDLLGTTDYFPNPPLGHSLKMGLGSIVDFIKSGGIIGNIFKSFTKKFQKPRVELVNKINFDAVVKEQERQKEVARQAAAEAASQRDAAIASGLDAAIREGRDTSGFDRPDSGAYAEGAGMGVGGGYASDYGFKKGGLATMFTRRR